MDSSSATKHSETIAATSAPVPSDWATIPSDIIQGYWLKHFDPIIDIPRVRGVCRRWRSAIPLSILPDQQHFKSGFEIPSFLNNDDDPPLLLLETRFFLLSPLNPAQGGQWVVRLSQAGPNKWHIHNPLNAYDYLFAHPPITAYINLTTCRVQHLFTSWVIGGGPDIMSRGARLERQTKKVVGGFNFQSDYKFAVLAQLEVTDHLNEGGLVLWRVGDNNVTRFEDSFQGNWRIVDIAYFHDKFYAFDSNSWQMGVIDVAAYGKDQTPEMMFFHGPDIKSGFIEPYICLTIDGCTFAFATLFFVPSNGRLFMVIVANPSPDVWVNEKVVTFFFVLNEKEGNTWERVPNIGDNIFFIGYDSSFSLPSASANLPYWKPGTICFLSHRFPMMHDHGKPEGTDGVMFPAYWRYLCTYQTNAEEEEEKGLVPCNKLDEHKYTALFFPPPAWVIWRCPSRGNALVVLHNLKFIKD